MTLGVGGGDGNPDLGEGLGEGQGKILGSLCGGFLSSHSTRILYRYCARHDPCKSMKIVSLCAHEVVKSGVKKWVVFRMQDEKVCDCGTIILDTQIRSGVSPKDHQFAENLANDA